MRSINIVEFSTVIRSNGYSKDTYIKMNNLKIKMLSLKIKKHYQSHSTMFFFFEKIKLHIHTKQQYIVYKDTYKFKDT